MCASGFFDWVGETIVVPIVGIVFLFSQLLKGAARTGPRIGFGMLLKWLFK